MTPAARRTGPCASARGAHGISWTSRDGGVSVRAPRRWELWTTPDLTAPMPYERVGGPVRDPRAFERASAHRADATVIRWPSRGLGRANRLVVPIQVTEHRVGGQASECSATPVQSALSASAHWSGGMSHSGEGSIGHPRRRGCPPGPLVPSPRRRWGSSPYSSIAPTGARLGLRLPEGHALWGSARHSVGREGIGSEALAHSLPG